MGTLNLKLQRKVVRTGKFVSRTHVKCFAHPIDSHKLSASDLAAREVIPTGIIAWDLSLEYSEWLAFARFRRRNLFDESRIPRTVPTNFALFIPILQNHIPY